MVIFLNGASSSGKTSIAKELLRTLKEPYFYLSIDHFLEPAMPLNINMDSENDIRIIDQAISGFNKALGAYSESINFIIVDHVLQHKSWLTEVATSLKSIEVFFVGVTAPLDILEMREQKRTDRQSGTAKAQVEVLNSYQYDLILNTAELSPEEAARKIISTLSAGVALQNSALSI